jgi:hypothetical protein
VILASVTGCDAAAKRSSAATLFGKVSLLVKSISIDDKDDVISTSLSRCRMNESFPKAKRIWRGWQRDRSFQSGYSGLDEASSIRWREEKQKLVARCDLQES